MNYKKFEDLPVWNAAIEFALELFEFTAKSDFRGVGDLKNQIERAAVSISNNIAEGFERGTNNDVIYFLYISKGSAGECRSMLRICERAKKFSNFRSEISNLITREESISRQLNGWIESPMSEPPASAGGFFSSPMSEPPASAGGFFSSPMSTPPASAGGFFSPAQVRTACVSGRALQFREQSRRQERESEI